MLARFPADMEAEDGASLQTRDQALSAATAFEAAHSPGCAHALQGGRIDIPGVARLAICTYCTRRAAHHLLLDRDDIGEECLRRGRPRERSRYI
jgi:hypothetical protein